MRSWRSMYPGLSEPHLSLLRDVLPLSLSRTRKERCHYGTMYIRRLASIRVIRVFRLIGVIRILTSIRVIRVIRAFGLIFMNDLLPLFPAG